MFYTRELYHHGVKGQKWGVRRYQYDNGTWTEEGKRRRRTGDGRHIGSTPHSEKKLPRYANYMFKSGTINSGTEINNISFNETPKSYKERSRMYATVLPSDKRFYNSVFVKTNNRRYSANLYKELKEKKIQLKSLENAEDVDSIEKDIKDIKSKIKDYQKEGATQFLATYKAARDLHYAGYDDASDEFSKFWNETNNKKRSEIIRRAEHAIETNVNSKKSMTPLLNRFKKAIKLRKEGKLSDKDWNAVLRNEGYKLYNNGITYEYLNDKNGKSLGNSEVFMRRLRKRGFDAIVDYNDQSLSTYNADLPLIFISERNGKDMQFENVKKIDQRKTLINNVKDAYGTAEAMGMLAVRKYRKRKANLDKGNSGYGQYRSMRRVDL